jgi:hypothetical protein
MTGLLIRGMVSWPGELGASYFHLLIILRIPKRKMSIPLKKIFNAITGEIVYINFYEEVISLEATL